MSTFERPWGTYTNILCPDKDTPCRVKKIVVKPGKRLSLQLHNHRHEHWVVVKGEGYVTVGGAVLHRKANDYVFIPVETKHRIENKGTEELIFVEVQYGDYLEEDDIVRFQDDFGRV